MSDTVQYPQFSAEGLPLTYVPDPQRADGKPVDSQWKQPVRVHTDGNIVLSGLQVVDGISVMEGDRVLVKDQINAPENGIYIASAGNWYRAPDMRLWEQFVSAVVAVEEGASPGQEVYISSVAASGTVGVTDVHFIVVNQATGTIPTFTPLRALVTNAVGEATSSPTTAQEIAFVSGVTSAIQPQFAALDNKASSAFSIAVDGTNAAAAAQSTANSALSTANAAFSIAVSGTNAAQSAFLLAQIGTNTGTAAYQLAQSGSNLASAAYALASYGTDVSLALSVLIGSIIGDLSDTTELAHSGSNIAYDGYQIAVAGTTIGSLAYTVATALGDKYVRTTRFASIGAGTSGTVTLPANSTVVLDDFGGGVDAVITTISAGRPTFSHAFTAAGDLVTTSFDAGGNYTLSGAPSAYPVALVYRVRQKLSDFDSTSSDIIGDYDVEGLDSIQGTANQVYVNGSLTPQFGVAVLSTPQDIAPTSSPTFANLTITGSVSVAAGNVEAIVGTQNQVLANGAFAVNTTGTVTLTTPQNIAPTSAVTFGSVFASGSAFTPLLGATEIGVGHVHFALTSGTVARQTGCLRWNNTDNTLDLDMTGTSVTLQIGQEILLYARNNSGVAINNGQVVYVSGAISDTPTIALASAATRSQSRGVVGLATENIPAGSLGYVCTQGLVRDFDTSALTEGRPVFLSSTVAGGLTLIPPTQPNSTVFVGICIKKSAAQGIVWVDVRPTDALNELQDVYVPTRQVGDHLVYNGTVWVNEAGTTTSPTFQVSTITAGTTIVPAVPALRRVYLADTSSGSIIVALPNSTGWTGQMVHVKKKTTDGQRVTVRSATGTATIDGSLEQGFTAPYTSIQITTDGNNWYIV